MFSFITTKPVMASGYIPIFSEIKEFIYYLKNPEPHGNVVLTDYWFQSVTNPSLLLSLSEDNEGKQAYLCSAKNISKHGSLGFAFSQYGPCYITYSNGKFISTQIVNSNFLIYAPEYSKSYFFEKKHYWNKPISKSKQKERHVSIPLFMAKDYNDLVAVCKVDSKGVMYLGFILINKSINDFNKKISSGKALCHYKPFIMDDDVHKEVVSQILYWITK